MTEENRESMEETKEELKETVAAEAAEAAEAEASGNAEAQEAEKADAKQADGAQEGADKTPEAAAEDAKEAPEETPDPLAESEKKVSDLTDRLQRQMAEFENFRRRSEKEKSAMFDMGARSVIEKILPVVDNFERGLAAVPAEEKDGPIAAGMEKIYKQLMDELSAIGVKPIKAQGENFDPNMHNAVMHIDDDTIDENIVVEEFQKGYTYHDTVIRYSMVKVAN